MKEAVLPFARFPGADPVLGPEMRATGEVMGLGGSFPEAFAKAQRGAGQALPRRGRRVHLGARRRQAAGGGAGGAAGAAPASSLVATSGTAAALGRGGPAGARGQQGLGGVAARRRPHRRAGEVALVVNTPRGGHGARTDGYEIRAAADPRRASPASRRSRPPRRPPRRSARPRAGAARGRSRTTGRAGRGRAPSGRALRNCLSLNLRGRFWSLQQTSLRLQHA